MTRRPPVYPVFLPYAGCPFQCIYCDQPAVTAVDGQQELFALASGQMAALAEQASAQGQPGEVAFYGGTFTALPIELLTRILDLAATYVDAGVFTGIRFSTRPDCLDDGVLALLAKNPITTVELGIQSLAEAVLEASRRGYSRAQALAACARVQQYRWDLGIQLMAGLPEDTPQRFLTTVLESLAVRPKFLRIHPVLVFPGTGLARRMARGLYTPLTVEQAVAWCVPAWDACIRAGVPVARLGLMISGGAGAGVNPVAGPWHPAFGQLVRSAWWRRRIDEVIERQLVSGAEPFPVGAGCSRDPTLSQLQAAPTDPVNGVPDGNKLEPQKDYHLNIRVGPRQLSDVLGWKRQNLSHWRNRWGFQQVRVEAANELETAEHAWSLAMASTEPAATHYSSFRIHHLPLPARFP